MIREMQLLVKKLRKEYGRGFNLSAEEENYLSAVKADGTNLKNPNTNNPIRNKRELVKWVVNNSERVDKHRGGTKVFGTEGSVGYTIYVSGNTLNTTHNTGSRVSDWMHVFYTYEGEHVKAIIDLLNIKNVKSEPTHDYPEGRKLDCGCIVFDQVEVMNASMGSSCELCYDRMSN